MRRFLSTLLTLTLIGSVLPRLGGNNSVAAQEVQQEQNSGAASPVPQNTEGGVRIPDGTPIDIEAPYTLQSIDFKPNDKISFRVVNPIMINGVTVVEVGATATGRIEQDNHARHF